MSSMPRGRVVLLMLLALAGCDDPALQRGVPPPITLNQSTAVIPLYEYGAARVLRSQVAALGTGVGTDRLDASIETLSEPETEATRDLLLRLGFNPTRITARRNPGNILVLTRTVATVTPCGAALHSDWLGDVGNSITSLGTCVQANNLAGMLDEPRDLATPVRFQPSDGAVSALAIQRWEQGDVKEPPRTSLSGDEGASTAGDGQAAAAPPAPQSAGVPSVNPLLSNAPLSGAPGASAE